MSYVITVGFAVLMALDGSYGLLAICSLFVGLVPLHFGARTSAETDPIRYIITAFVLKYVVFSTGMMEAMNQVPNEINALHFHDLLFIIPVVIFAITDADKKKFSIAHLLGENSPFGFVVVDQTGLYVEMNRAYSEMVGWPMNELIGKKKYLDITPARYHAKGVEALKSLNGTDVSFDPFVKYYFGKDNVERGCVIQGFRAAKRGNQFFHFSIAIPFEYQALVTEHLEQRMKEMIVSADKMEQTIPLMQKVAERLVIDDEGRVILKDV